MQFLGKLLFYVVVFAVVDLIREKVGGGYTLVFIAGVITGHLLSGTLRSASSCRTRA